MPIARRPQLARGGDSPGLSGRLESAWAQWRMWLRLPKSVSPIDIAIVALGLMVLFLPEVAALPIVIASIALGVEEAHWLLFSRYFYPREWARGLAFGFPVLGIFSLAGAILFEFLLGGGIRLAILGSLTILTISVIARRTIHPRAGIGIPHQHLLRDNLRTNILAFFVLIGSAGLVLTIYLGLSFSGAGTFVFTDQTFYTGTVVGLSEGGRNLFSGGISQFSIRSTAYLSSSLTLGSWLFYAFGWQVGPLLFYPIVNALFAAEFVLTAYILLFADLPPIRAGLGTLCAIGGLSCTGALWLLGSLSGAGASGLAPNLYLGTFFPIPPNYGYYVLAAMNEVYYKAFFHGLSYASVIVAFYFFSKRSESPARSQLLGLAFTAAAIIAYQPVGLILLLSIVVVWVGNLLGLRRNSSLALLALAVPLFLMIASFFVALDKLPVGFITLPISSVIAACICLGIFVFLFPLILTTWGGGPAWTVISVDPACSLPVVTAVLSGGFLVLLITLIPSGVADNYEWGISLSLALLFLLRYALNPRGATPVVESPVKGSASRLSDAAIAGSRGNRQIFPEGQTGSLFAIVVVVFLMAATLANLAQPALHPGLLDSTNGVRVTSAEVDLATWMRSSTPLNSIFLVPPSEWVLPVLSGRAITGTPTEAVGSTPGIALAERFYAQGISANFSTNSSLAGWYETPGDGHASISNNATLNGTPTLEVLKQNYSQVSSPAVSIPLSDTQLTFSVYPTLQVQQPNIALGVVLGLSDGKELAFLSSWSTGVLPINPAVLVIHENMTTDSWNHLSLNVTSALSTFPSIDPSTTTIVNVQLEGGLGRIIFWGGISVAIEPESKAAIMSSLKSLSVAYIVANESVSNQYIPLLLQANWISQVYSSPTFAVYITMDPYPFSPFRPRGMGKT
jgi:hypothetical protein